MRKSRVVAFPTAIFIALHDDIGERVTLAEGATLKEAIVNLRKAFGGRLPNYWGPLLRAGRRIRVWRGWEIESMEDGETDYVEAYEIDDDKNEEPL
jgi:hypothetical protein